MCCWGGKERVSGSTRGTPPATPARRHDALAARVRRLVEEVYNGRNLAALDAAAGPAGSPLRDYLAAAQVAARDLCTNLILL